MRLGIRKLDFDLSWLVPALLRSWLSETHLAQTSRVVGRIASEAPATEVRLLVVIILTRSQILDPLAESLRSCFPALRDDLDVEPVVRRSIPRLSQLPGADRVVDLLPYFRPAADENAWDRRDLHVPPRGHELCSEVIREPIAELLAKS